MDTHHPSNRGIGLALARDLLSKGWRVSLADLNAALGAKVVDELGSNAVFYKSNVAIWDDQVAVFEKTRMKWGRIDFVAANAGIGNDILLDTKSDSLDGPPKEPDFLTIDVNLKGAIFTSQLALHYFRRNPPEAIGGKIVITSSIAGLYPIVSAPLYTATKHGLVGYVRALAPHLEKEGITINTINPAFTLTPLVPKELMDLIDQGGKSPMSTLMRAFDKYIEDSTLNGKVAECVGEEIYYREPIAYPNEGERKAIEKINELSL